MPKEIVVSGIRPTGFLHLGNYFGALHNYIKMQHEYDCYFFIADWHSLTTHPDTTTLTAQVNRVLAEYIACGLNPDEACIYLQSDVTEIAELYMYLNMLAYKGELEKTPTFKDKVRQQPDNVNAGLLTYPVLQAADILIQRAVKVPVGKDQEQHLEVTRNLAERFNKRYSKTLTLPYAFNFGTELLKILSLNGNGKMSKSENQMNTIYLADEDDAIRKKIMRAKTDSGPAENNATKPDYIENLFTLLRLVSNEDVLQKFNNDYNVCNIRYGDFKKQLAEDMIAFIRPVREKTKDLLTDDAYLSAIKKQGAEKARENASITLQSVRTAIGFNN